KFACSRSTRKARPSLSDGPRGPPRRTRNRMPPTRYWNTLPLCLRSQMAAPSATSHLSEAAKPASEKRPPGDTLSSLQSLLVTVVIAVFVITFIVQAFQIPSESMQNTLLIGDYLLVDKTRYGGTGAWDWLMPYRPVRRGDIIVF